MIDLDGGEQSGSGTIVRFAVAFAALLGESLHLKNARARRAKPGLRPQHVAAVRACAELCGATVEGVEVGSREFTFVPRRSIRGGEFRWDIGTAGSTTMLALGVLPLACLADGPLSARIDGGVFQDFAPSPYHMQHVLAPLLGRMGVEVDLQVLRAGYVPGGAGSLALRVRPSAGGLAPLALTAPGVVRDVAGIALASHLRARRVAERMARACEDQLAASGLRGAIERCDDDLARHPGACLALWARSSTGCLLGADRAGARGRTSEAIGRFVAESLHADIAAGGTTDRHLADQLVLFAALACGGSEYVAPMTTDHLDTNLWLATRFGARARRDGHRVSVEGLRLRPAHRCRR